MLFNLDAGTGISLYFAFLIPRSLNFFSSLCAGHFASFAESTSMHGWYLRGTIQKALRVKAASSLLSDTSSV